jgi:hypothetical protein
MRELRLLALNVLFDRLEGLVAQVMLDLAGIVGRDPFVNAELYEKLGEEFVALVHLVRYLRARVGQGKIAVLVNVDVSAAL